MDVSDGPQRRPRNAVAARKTILDAAETVFAEHGFDGARVDTIAAQAGYNKSLLFLYFGDKLGLYRAILARAEHESLELRAGVLAPLLEHPELATDWRALQAFLTQTFRALFEHFQTHPRLLRILVWEMAAGWQNYGHIMPAVDRDADDPVDRLFAQAQRTGLIRSPFVTRIQLALVLQICQVYLASLPLFQLLSPAEDLTSPPALAQARDYLVRLLVAGILSDPPVAGES